MFNINQMIHRNAADDRKSNCVKNLIISIPCWRKGKTR